MKKLMQCSLTALCVAMCASAWSVSVAAAPRVAELLHWSADTDRAQITATVKKGNALYAKLGCGCITRLWGSSVGGDNGYTLVIEFPSLLAYAQFQTKLGESPEWLAFISEMQAHTSLKRPTSALIEDITP